MAASCENLNGYVEGKVSTNLDLVKPRGSEDDHTPLLCLFLAHRGEAYCLDGRHLLVESLLKLGANPNDTFLGVTVWQYWLHFLHSYSYLAQDQVARDIIKRIIRLMLDKNVDLDAGCIRDREIWAKVYYSPQNGDWGIWREALEYHMNEAENSSDKDEDKYENRDEDKAEDANPKHGSHSLTSIIKDLFNTEEDPHGADDLLEYIEELKKAKREVEGREVERRRLAQPSQGERFRAIHYWCFPLLLVLAIAILAKRLTQVK
jgi:hypothetical protein